MLAPLRKGDRVVGCLKLYGTDDIELQKVHFELAKGLGDLFSTQLELQDIQTQNQLLAKAEIRRLQTQINPHFLFNALNTIGSFTRTKPDRARSLLAELAMYMRRNLEDSDGVTRIGAELDQIRSYLKIEQARFGDRVHCEWRLEEGVEDIEIPPLIIQPLVENGVKHGILKREEGGTIALSIARNNGLLHVVHRGRRRGHGPLHPARPAAERGRIRGRRPHRRAQLQPAAGADLRPQPHPVHRQPSGQGNAGLLHHSLRSRACPPDPPRFKHRFLQQFNPQNRIFSVLP